MECVQNSTLPPDPPKRGSKSDFLIKLKSIRIKSATKFSCVKTSSGEIVV